MIHVFVSWHERKCTTYYYVYFTLDYFCHVIVPKTHSSHKFSLDHTRIFSYDSTYHNLANHVPCPTETESPSYPAVIRVLLFYMKKCPDRHAKSGRACHMRCRYPNLGSILSQLRVAFPDNSYEKNLTLKP